MVSCLYTIQRSCVSHCRYKRTAQVVVWLLYACSTRTELWARPSAAVLHLRQVSFGQCLSWVPLTLSEVYVWKCFNCSCSKCSETGRSVTPIQQAIKLTVTDSFCPLKGHVSIVTYVMVTLVKEDCCTSVCTHVKPEAGRAASSLHVTLI